MIKEGAAVIDVGINRVQDPITGKSRLVGDVDFEGTGRTEWMSAVKLPSGVSVTCFLSTLRREEEGGIHHPGSWRSWPHDRSNAHEEHRQSHQECPADSPGENPFGCCVLMSQSVPSCSDSFHPATPPLIFIFFLPWSDISKLLRTDWKEDRFEALSAHVFLSIKSSHV